MEILILVLIFILGLVIGSFTNALEYRIEEKKSIQGRSFCPQCKHQLVWHDLIPVVSYIFLRGKCRYCGKKISIQYPIIELLGGLSFAAVAYQTSFAGKLADFIVKGADPMTIFYTLVAFVSLLFVLFILLLVGLHDQKTSYVLSGYVYAGIVATLVYLFANSFGSFSLKALEFYYLPHVLAAVVAALPFAILHFVSKGKWMGAGDIEIAALLGFLLGWPDFLVALYFAFIVGSVWGVVKVYLLKNAGLKSEMPFAPFLIAGTVFALLLSRQITLLYVTMFLG